jgi:membrane protein implicated in regulation of membrane protease activity
MRQSLLYFIAAALFAVATGLNLFNDGFNLKTVLGAVFVAVMLLLGARLRRTER